jgi:hypothetical protein
MYTSNKTELAMFVNGGMIGRRETGDGDVKGSRESKKIRHKKEILMKPKI